VDSTLGDGEALTEAAVVMLKSIVVMLLLLLLLLLLVVLVLILLIVGGSWAKDSAGMSVPSSSAGRVHFSGFEGIAAVWSSCEQRNQEVRQHKGHNMTREASKTERLG
jgi:hypothetical protein